MCGIVGYVGMRSAQQVLLDGLEKLEYRGYDSAGVALTQRDGIRVVKSKGRLSTLRSKLEELALPQSSCGIGHTRWATHGEPSDVNSHPHSTPRVSIVHNGIIENYGALKERLIAKGYTFASETDTEVLVKLIDSCYQGEPLQALQAALAKVRGSYALAVLFKDYPDTIFAASGSGSTGGTTNTTTVVDDLRSVLVPTTSEILWGVIDGSLLSTVWNRITSSSGSLLSIGLKQLANITGQPMSTILNFVGGGATYICYVNGSQASFSTSIKYPVLAGGLAVRQNVNGTVKAMIQLMPMKIDQVGAASVMSNGTRYETADDMQVYLWYKGQYYATKLSEVNSEGYYLTGWYDNFGCAAGKRVRVIVAVKKD